MSQVSYTLLQGGTIVDPGRGTASVGDVLVEDGRVAAVGPELRAPFDAIRIDVRGLIVGPGFVDLHSHVHSVAGHRLQAMDGVTTALDLEAGLMPIERAYKEAADEGRPLHFGFSTSWSAARAQILLGREADAGIGSTLAVMGDPDWQRSSSPSELNSWLSLLERDLAAGALGIGVLLGYAPQSDPLEYRAVAELAASAGAPTFTHVRDLVEVDPSTPIDGSEELVIAAAETGASMHHCHVNSTSFRHVDRVLRLLDRSRAAGSRVTVEAYPYGSGSTGIGAAFLAPEGLAARGISPSQLLITSTGERIADADRLREIRQTDPDAPCIFEYLDEQDPVEMAMLQRSLAFPDSIVASDAVRINWPDGSYDSDEWPLPSGGRTHPRTAGTFTRSLRLMVREQGIWDWLEAFRRCSYLPARVLDQISPDASRKGHLAVGADADIVVLDPNKVTDRATYFEPTRPAQGIHHLMVHGTFVVRNGSLDPEVRPGRGLRGSPVN